MCTLQLVIVYLVSSPQESLPEVQNFSGDLGKFAHDVILMSLCHHFGHMLTKVCATHTTTHNMCPCVHMCNVHLSIKFMLYNSNLKSKLAVSSNTYFTVD